MYSINNNNIYLITELKLKQGSVIIKILVNNLNIFSKRESYKLDMESNTSRQARTSELVSYVGIVL